MSSSTSFSFVRILGTSGVDGRGEGQFAQPRGVAIDTKAKEIFVCDCNNHRVCVYNSKTLKFERYIGRGVQGASPGCLNYAVGLCIDGNNHLYVADTNNHRIVVFNQSTGAHIRNIGHQGSEPGLLNSPYGVCIDRSTGSLFVADYENHRVQVFNKDSGAVERVVGLGFGSNPGQLNQPIVLCIDDDNGNLFVADYCNNRVQVFNKDTGHFIRQIGGHGIPGISQNYFVGPRGLCIDSRSGLLFVADRENHRIQIYNKNTFVFIRHVGGGPGLGPGMFNRPMELCVNKEDGTLLVVDGYNHRVQILGVPELQAGCIRPGAARHERMEQEERFKPRPSRLAVCSEVKEHFVVCAERRIVRFAALNSPNYDTRLSAEEYLSLGLLAPPLASSAAVATVQSPALPSPVDAQADLFMKLICDTGAAGIEPSLYVPSVLALQGLLDRHWQPGRGVEASFVALLLDLVFSVNSCTVDEDEKSRVLETCLHILARASDHNAANRDLLLQRVLAQLEGSTKLSTASGAGEADRAVATMLSFILLSHILADSSLEGRLAAAAAEASPSHDLGAGAPSFRRDVNDLFYGPAFLSSLARAQAAAGSAGAIVATAGAFSKHCGLDNDLSSLVALLQATYNMNKLRLAASAASSAQELERAQLSLLGAAHTFISRSQEVYQPLSHAPEAYQRGGRNIWRADDPLREGDLVDALDRERSWFESYIVGISNGQVRIHFMGWGSKWDDDILESDLPTRIAPLNSKTKNWRADLFEGGLIEIKCNDDTVNQKWMWGRIIALNVPEAWVEVSYSFAHEPAIIKGADLYGETICPVGMHTKDKSKYAAAAIVKPARSPEELSSSNKNDFDSSQFAHCTDDAFFDPECPSHSSLVSNSGGHPCLPASTEGGSARGACNVSSLTSAISHVAASAFATLTREVCWAVTHSEAESALFAEGLAVIRALATGPHQKLVYPSFCRVMMVQAGLRAKIAVAGCLQERGGSLCDLLSAHRSGAGLLDKLAALEEGYCSLLLKALGEAVPLSVVRHTTERLQATISTCAMMHCGDSAEEPSSSELLASRVFQDLLDHDRFSPTAAAARRVLRHVLLAASPSAAEKLKQAWIGAIKVSASKICSSYTHASTRDDGTSMVNSLVLLLEKARSLSHTEFLQTAMCPVSAEIAFMRLFSELSLELRITMSKFLALSLSSLMDVSKSEYSLGTRTVKREALIALVRALVMDATSPEFGTFYEALMSRRLVRRRYDSLAFEASVLSQLPPMMNAQQMLHDISLADRYTQDFRNRLLRAVDAGDVQVDASIALAVSGAVSVAVLSSGLWPAQTVSPLHYASLRMPRTLQSVQQRFEQFFSSSSDAAGATGSSCKRLFWCRGLGTVTMSCRLYSGGRAFVSAGEPQCAVLMAVDALGGAGGLTVARLGEETQLATEQLAEVLSSLSGGAAPLLEVSGSVVALARSFLSGEYGGETLAAPIVAQAVLGASSTYEVAQKDWRACAIEAFVARTLKRISTETSEKGGAMQGYLGALSLRGILEAAARDMPQLHLPATQGEVEACCSRLASLGIIELVGGTGGVLDAAEGYAYLPAARSSSLGAGVGVGVGSDVEPQRGVHIFEALLAALGVPHTDLAGAAIKSADFVDLLHQRTAMLVAPPQPLSTFLRRSTSLFDSAAQPLLPYVDSAADAESKIISNRVVDVFGNTLAQLAQLCARHARYLEGAGGPGEAAFASQLGHIDKVSKTLSSIVAAAGRADVLGVLKATLSSLSPTLLASLVAAYETLVGCEDGDATDSIYDRLDALWGARRGLRKLTLQGGLQVFPLAAELTRELAAELARGKAAARQTPPHGDDAVAADSIFVTMEDFVRAIMKVSYDFAREAAWQGPRAVAQDPRAEIAHLRLRHKQRSGELQQRATLPPAPLPDRGHQSSTARVRLSDSEDLSNIPQLRASSPDSREGIRTSFNESKSDSSSDGDALDAIFSSKISTAHPLGRMLSIYARRLEDVLELFLHGGRDGSASGVSESAMRRTHGDYFSPAETTAVVTKLLASASTLLVEADLWGSGPDSSYKDALLGASSFAGALRRVFQTLDCNGDGLLTVSDFDDFCEQPLHQSEQRGAATDLAAGLPARDELDSSSWRLLSSAHVAAACSQELWDGISAQLEKDLRRLICLVTEVSPALAAEKTHDLLQMLAAYKWDANTLVDDYSLNARQVRLRCHVYATFQCRALQTRGGGGKSSGSSAEQVLCGGCDAQYSSTYIYALSCRHCFCVNCWRRHVMHGSASMAAAKAAPRYIVCCLSPGCRARAGHDFIEFLGEGSVHEAYAHQELRSRSREYAAQRAGAGFGLGEAAALYAKWRGYSGSLSPYIEGASQLCTTCLRPYHWPAPCAAAALPRSGDPSPGYSPLVHGFYEDVAAFRRVLAPPGPLRSAEGPLPPPSSVLDSLADCLDSTAQSCELLLHAQTTEQLFALGTSADCWRLLAQSYSVIANVQSHLCLTDGVGASTLRLRLLLVALAASNARLQSEATQWSAQVVRGTADWSTQSRIHLHTALTKKRLIRLLDSWIRYLEQTSDAARAPVSPRSPDCLLLHAASHTIVAPSPFHQRDGRRSLYHDADDDI